MQDFEPISNDQPGSLSDDLTESVAETPAEAMPEPTEEVHVSLAAAVKAHRSVFLRPAGRRLFGIPLAGGLSLTTSILVHVAIVGAGFGLYRHFRPPVPPPTINFALGDASQTRNEIFWKEQTAGGMGMPELSEMDPAQAPPDSSAAVMHQLESNRAPDFPVNNLASTYIGPRPIWSEAPNAGAQANATAKLGTFAPAHPGAQSAKPTSGLTAPQTGRGNGQGNAAGSGNANANTGRAGVKTGAPDISGLPKPEYPEESLRRREEGTVMVSVTVLSDGSVGEITVVSTPPFSRLTRKALDAARQVRFDRAYAGWVVKIPYEFKLPD